jgi:DNA-binding Lrp family transcriptional regulator
MYYKYKIVAMEELEHIDVKIIKMLLKDGRRSFKDIAQQCGTSSDLIWEHYTHLKRAGIIAGATIQFNFKRMGYNGFATIMLNVESQNLLDVFDRLSRVPDIFTYRSYNSIYNIAAISTQKSLSDLENIKQVINRQNKINEFKIFYWTDVRNIPENILDDPTEKETENTSLQEYESSPLKINGIDEKIIDALSVNGRLAFSKIAQQNGASATTISRRYELLKRNHIIKASIQINPLKLGFQNILEISLALSDKIEINEMVNDLSKISGVTYLVKISGGNYDLLVVSLVKDCKNIVDINDQIAKIVNIKKMEATLRRLPPIWPGPSQYITTF